MKCTATSNYCTVTGLTNGASYTFTVTASSTAAGTSAASRPSKSVVPAVTPGAPWNVKAVGRYEQAVVSWAAPTSGPQVSYYDVYVYHGLDTTNPDGCSTPRPSNPSTIDTWKAPTTCTVTGLANGATYKFIVSAVDVNGNSTLSVLSQGAVPRITEPGAPDIVSATAGNGQAVIRWKWPTYFGGNDFDSFTATATPGGKTCQTTAPDTSCTITGLTNGTSYTFAVTTTDTAGAVSPPSPSTAPVTPKGGPAAPSAVSATSADRSLTVSWTAPADNGSPITGYLVKVKTTAKVVQNVTATTSPAVITGLTNGTSYTVTVTAKNSAGLGDESAATDPVTPVAAAAAPSSVTAKTTGGGITVTWKAPASTGGLPITKYVVTAQDVTAPAGTALSADATASPYLFTGLQPGHSYTFSVAAVTSFGSSPDSASSTSAICASAPGMPGDVKVSVNGASTLNVSWRAPTDTGGTALTGYLVTLTRIDTGVSATQQVPAARTTLQLTNLGPGVAYSVSVAATNAAGTSNSTSAVTATPGLPTAAPGEVRKVSAKAGYSSAVITWTAPASNGGSPVMSYTVTSAPDAKQCTASAPAVTCTITGLTNGTAYTFTAVAANTVGTSPVSAPSNSVTPNQLPGTPMNLTATTGSGRVTLSWAAPTDGGPVSRYTVTASPLGKTCSTESTSCTIVGLANGTAYTFSVVATNSTGDGTASSPAAATPNPTAPDAPTDVSVTFKNGQAVIKWSQAATASGGSAVTSYTVTSIPDGKTCTAAAPARTCTIAGLTYGTSYTFSVTATNTVGTGPAGVTAAALVPAYAPDAPSGLTASAGAAGLVLAWTAPSANGSPITGYYVTIKSGSKVVTSTITTDTSFTARGLAAGVDYTVTIRARNSVGSSADATVVASIPATS